MSFMVQSDGSRAPLSTPLQAVADTRQGRARCLSKSSVIGNRLEASHSRLTARLSRCYYCIRQAQSRLEKSSGMHKFSTTECSELIENRRYTLTYTPSADRILPAPKYLHVKVKNTCATPLRAAYLHGPYTLYVACYPSTFNPNSKHERAKEEGIPEFEPNLKAGGQWNAKLTVPEDVREAAGGPQSRQSLDGDPRSFTWISVTLSSLSGWG